MQKQYSTKHILIETIQLFVAVTIVGLIIEVGYDLLKGHQLSISLNEWAAKNTSIRTLVIRLIISFGIAYFGILRKEAKVKKQSKAA
jgi:F0F1-type ATP synthase assembly protein I